MSANWLKRKFFAPLLGLIFALTPLSTPVHATSNLSNALLEGHTEPILLAVEEDESGSPSSGRTEATAESEGASPVTTGTSDPSQNGTTDSSSENADNTTTETSCHDQIGALGWLICPSTGFLATIIDSLYGAIEDLLVVEPLTTDTDTPIFVIWNYARNISNILFVILILVIVYSQLTGLGISNYGIKRTLPRIIIAAILVNLSYLLSSLAVDISNILGASIRTFLTGVGEAAMASGSINPNLNISVQDIFLAIGTGSLASLGIATAIGAAGGLTAVLIGLIPVIVGAVISVITGFLTISLRQAVISILVMISPLAFVAYLLPNTEKYFDKWSKLFVQMIVFYPMFSLLFGASRLAGWAILTSAENGISIILGIAVQFFPLFAGVKLMQMSGTALGGINAAFQRLGARGVNATRNFTSTAAAERRAEYFANNPRGRYDFARRVGQNLYYRRARSIAHTRELENVLNQKTGAHIAQSFQDENGHWTKDGIEHYDNMRRGMEYQNTMNHINAQFDQGLSEYIDPNDAKAKAIAAKSDEKMIAAADRMKHEAQFAAQVALDNQRSYATRVHDAYDANKARKNGQAYDRNAMAYYNAMAYNTAGNSEAINSIIANAISTRERADRSVRENYTVRFDEAEYTAEIIDEYHSALQNKDVNATVSAIQALMRRGDTDEVAKGLYKYSDGFSSSSAEDLNMQKAISDTLLGYKGDNVLLSSYAKSLNMARGKAEAKRRINLERQSNGQAPIEVNPDYFSFHDYFEKDGVAAKWHLDADTLIGTVDEGILPSQDRTFYNYAKERGRILGTETQRRNSLYSGNASTGEKRESNLDMYLGPGATWEAYDAAGHSISSKSGSERKVLTFKDVVVKKIDEHGNEVEETITAAEQLEKSRRDIAALIAGNNAGHITKTKSVDLTAFYAIMTDSAMRTEADGSIVFDFQDGNSRTEAIKAGIQYLIDEGIDDGNGKKLKFDAAGISADLKKLSDRGALNAMNAGTRAIFNSVLHFEPDERAQAANNAANNAADNA